jgi:hypothetical protein
MADPKPGCRSQSPTRNNDEPNPRRSRPARSYSQEEVDRIADKVRRNAARCRAGSDARCKAPAPRPREERPAEAEGRRAEARRLRHARGLPARPGRIRRAARPPARSARRKRTKRASAPTRSSRPRPRKPGREDRARAGKHDDFEDVLEDNAETFELIAKSPMRGFITESDIGPEIVYGTCALTEEGRAKRSASRRSPGYKQAAEIAKIEDKLVAAAKPKDEKEEPKGGTTTRTTTRPLGEGSPRA